jgi:aspartate aminotransferase
MARAEARSALAERIGRIEISATLAVVNEAERLRSSGADLVDFGAGEPHFSTPAHIKEAAMAAIRDDFSRYTAVGGTGELRDALVRRHAADFETAYRREECIACVGGKHALFNALQVLVDHGDEVVLPAPYWVSFKDIIRYAGGTPVVVETREEDDFALTAEMVERTLTPRTRAIILNSPSNPSGAVVSREDVQAIVRLAHRRGIYLISDECYVYLDYSGEPFSAASLEEAREHILVIGSLSKTYAMTGWRLGYALGPANIIAAMQKLQSQSTSNPTSIVQKAAVAAVSGPQQCVAEMRAEYIRLRAKMLEGLRAIDGLRCAWPQGAFYAFPNVSAFFGRGGMNSGAGLAARLLREAGVVTVPGEAFGAPQHVRLSYATSEGDIERGLARMKDFFAAV